MIDNFNQNYLTNKAPFGFFVHSAWFMVGQNHFAAFLKFIDYLQGLPDVYLVIIYKTFLQKDLKIKYFLSGRCFRRFEMGEKSSQYFEDEEFLMVQL